MFFCLSCGKALIPESDGNLCCCFKFICKGACQLRHGTFVTRKVQGQADDNFDNGAFFFDECEQGLDGLIKRFLCGKERQSCGKRLGRIGKGKA